MIDLIETSREKMSNKYLKESMHEHWVLSLSRSQPNGNNIKQLKICLKYNTSDSPRPFLSFSSFIFTCFYFGFCLTFDCLANIIYIRLIIIIIVNVLEYTKHWHTDGQTVDQIQLTVDCILQIVVRLLSNASHKMTFQSVEWLWPKRLYTTHILTYSHIDFMCSTIIH